MVKLTILYNLPEDADHDAFLNWRTQTHQADNAKPPTLKTDFYRVHPSPFGEPKYRYITEVYFADMATLEATVFNESAQTKLANDLTRIANPLFLISEEVVTTVVATENRVTDRVTDADIAHKTTSD
jgi:hypothetical protein